MTQNKHPQGQMVDINKIMQLIPHRYPFLLVDKVLITEPQKKAIGFKNVTANEMHFIGHFPDNPIMPGVLIVEALAQAAAVLVVGNSEDESKDQSVYFTSIDECRFRKPVVPGDVVELHVETLRNRRGIWKFQGVAMVDGEKAAEGVFSAMIVDKND